MKDNEPLRIGLTGGVASGKSTVADMFAEFGVPVIDTDVIAREVVAPGQPALEEIRASFGPEVIAPDGALDRRAMRRIVFAEPARRRELEAILHPRIREEALRQASVAEGPYLLIVVPLLVESPLRHEVDRIIVVDCSERTQVERLMQRDTESEAHAREILAAQATRDERLAIATDVVSNDGDLDATRQRVRELDELYRSLQAD